MKHLKKLKNTNALYSISLKRGDLENYNDHIPLQLPYANEAKFGPNMVWALVSDHLRIP